MNKIFTQLLKKRHLDDAFLHPRYEALANPFTLPDMKKAVQRLRRAVEQQEHVLIYGDYDVDGITAATLMEQALTLAGIPPEHLQIMLPDRFVDGYGMSHRCVDHAKAFHASLVVTVDCGSRNHDVIKELKTAGINTIVTDHHECAATLPEAVAVVNPKRPDASSKATPPSAATSPSITASHHLHDLAGVGVAFKLAQALVAEGLIPSGQEKWLLDLVLIGTICDSMSLTGENRILCHYGIKVLAKTRRRGLLELMRIANVNPARFTSEVVSFQLGPRLNAAGRLESAELALNLLRTASAPTAAALATQLDQLNHARRTAQRAATAEITGRLPTHPTTPVIVEVGDWHEGILGIVAGRLVEQYHQPAFVLTALPDGTLKGSGRSFGDFSLAAALDAAASTIISGGGHAAAAGVRLAQTQLPAFTTAVNQYYTSLHLPSQEHFFHVTPDLQLTSLDDFTLDLLDDLAALEPFGIGNAEPLFCLTGGQIVEQRRLGADGRHLQLDLAAGSSPSNAHDPHSPHDSRGQVIKTIAFSAPEAWFTLNPATPHDFFLRPTVNEWRGTRSLEARLVDVV